MANYRLNINKKLSIVVFQLRTSSNIDEDLSQSITNEIEVAAKCVYVVKRHACLTIFVDR